MEKQHETLEIPWKNPEQILSPNCFRVLKVLIQLDKTKPNKVKAKDIWKIIDNLSKSKIYDCLKELENIGIVEHKRPYYSLKGLDKPKPSEKKLRENISREMREYLERRAEFYEHAEWLAEISEVYKPLKDFADISRKVRKELGLE